MNKFFHFIASQFHSRGFAWVTVPGCLILAIGCSSESTTTSTAKPSGDANKPVATQSSGVEADTEVETTEEVKTPVKESKFKFDEVERPEPEDPGVPPSLNPPVRSDSSSKTKRKPQQTFTSARAQEETAEMASAAEAEAAAKTEPAETEPAEAESQDGTTTDVAAADDSESAEDKYAAIDPQTDGTKIEVAEDGAVQFMATGDWEVVKPRNRIVEYEIKIAKVDGDAEELPAGRLTIMGAMGSVEANIARWQGQFKQPDGGSSADATEETVIDVGGNEVTIVDLSGTFVDTMGGGPFSGGKQVDRPEFRMLAAIIQAGSYGQYFVKFTGSDKTVSANHDKFIAMIKSLNVGE